MVLTKAVVQCQCGKYYNTKHNRRCPSCFSGVLMGMDRPASPDDLARLKDHFTRG